MVIEVQMGARELVSGGVAEEFSGVKGAGRERGYLSRGRGS